MSDACSHSLFRPVATSSYVSLAGQTIYSAGGPTAELHRVSSDGGFGEKIQQLQYVTDEEMKTTDRTRKALVGSSLDPCFRSVLPKLKSQTWCAARWFAWI